MFSGELNPEDTPPAKRHKPDTAQPSDMRPDNEENVNDINPGDDAYDNTPQINPDLVSKEDLIALLRDACSRQNTRQEIRSRPTHTINVGNLEKLQYDISLHDFILWREQWEQTYQLQNIHTFPRVRQVSALKSTFSLNMLEMVNKVLDIPKNGDEEIFPVNILDAIQNNLRATRNVAIDRIEFVQCRQHQGETFDSFYIKLRRLRSFAGSRIVRIYVIIA